MRATFSCLSLLLPVIISCQNEALPPELASKVSSLQLPDGFSISIYAYNTSSMKDPRGLNYFRYNESVSIVYTGSKENDLPVYALVNFDANNNNESEFIIPFLDPEQDSKYRDNSAINTIIVDHMTNYTFLFSTTNIHLCYNLHSYVLSLVPINDEMESVDLDCMKWMEIGGENSHNRRAVSFSPDWQYLCIPFGANCDVCLDPLPFQTIRCYDMNIIRNYDNSSFPVQWNDTNSFFIAKGVRNCVGFDWDINTNNIWFGDMDANSFDYDASFLNDEFDSELNVIDNFNELTANPTTDVHHYGYPYYYSAGIGDIIRREVGKATLFKEERFPAPEDETFYKLSKQPLGPRASPLGLKFYRRNSYDQTSTSLFPKKYDNKIFLALHGVNSDGQNRNRYIIGFKIICVEIGTDVVSDYEDFIVFLRNGKNITGEMDSRWTRPSFIEFMDDGSMLISDDYGDMVFRITYSDNARDTESSHHWLLFGNVAASVVVYCVISILIGIGLYFCYKKTKTLTSSRNDEDNIPLL